MTHRSVLCFGDSNTHGTMSMRAEGDKRRHAIGNRWTSVMANTLGKKWQVIPEGQPGRTSVFDDPVEGPHKSGLRALPMLLESHRPLDLVIILLGTNDLKARFGVSAQDVSLGLQRLVAHVKGSDSGVGGRAPHTLIACPVAVLETGVLAEMFAGAVSKSRALPERLKHMADRNAVGFVDLNTVASVDPTDGIHLDAQAHLAIGADLARRVQAMFETGTERT